MGVEDSRLMASLERWNSTAFFAGCLLFVFAAGTVGVDMVWGAERVGMLLGQSFVGVGWAAALGGLIGMYPAVAEGSRWPARLGGVCAAVGAVGYAVMSGVALSFFLEVTGGDLEAYFPVFLPVMVIGSFVAFPVFSVICLRSGVFSRGLALLLAIPPLIVAVNIVSASAPLILIGIDGALAVTMVAIGYRLRAETPVSERRRVDPPSEPAIG